MERGDSPTPPSSEREQRSNTDPQSQERRARRVRRARTDRVRDHLRSRRSQEDQGEPQQQDQDGGPDITTPPANEDPHQHTPNTAGAAAEPVPAPAVETPEQLAAREAEERREARNREYALDEHEQWAWDYINNPASGVYLLPPAEETVHFELTDELNELITRRASYAEAMTSAREGKVIGKRNKRVQRNLDQVYDQYVAAREHFMRSELDRLGDISLEEQRAFLVALAAKEDGVLIGEEVQGYANKPIKRTKLDAAFERYNNLSTKKKVIVAIGATALLGFTVGGISAGALFASRFAPKYFRMEAQRREEEAAQRNDPAHFDTLQRTGSLRSANQSAYRDHYRSLTTSNTDPFAHQHDQLHEDHTSISRNVLDERTDSTAEKRKAQRKAILAAGACAAAGGLVGWFLQSGTGWHGAIPALARGELLGDGWFGDNHFDAEINSPGSSEAGNGEDINGQASTHSEADFRDRTDAEGRVGNDAGDGEPLTDESEAPTETSTTPSSADTSTADTAAERGSGIISEGTEAANAISERSQELYGDFAGKTINVAITDGESVWHQLEHVVADQYPTMSDHDKGHMVENIFHELQHAYPGRDLSRVYAGEQFQVILPAQA